MQYLVAEFNYWLKNHMVSVEVSGRGGNENERRELRLARFNCEDAGPRPESYLEDYELASAHTSDPESRYEANWRNGLFSQKEFVLRIFLYFIFRARLYWELKTGAETGWDYSSRYLFCPPFRISIWRRIYFTFSPGG